MAQEWLSLAEISRRTGIAESSLRRYVRNFASHLPQEQAGKRWVFAEEAVEVFERIGAAYREGKTTDEISLLLGEGSGAGPVAPVPPAEVVLRSHATSPRQATVAEPALSSATVASFLSTVQGTMERMAEALEAVQHRDQERVLLLEDKTARQEHLLEDQRLRIRELEQKLHRVESLLFLTGDEKTTPLVVKEQLEKLQGDLALVRQIQEKEAVVRVLEQPPSRPSWWQRLFGFGH